MPELNSEDRRRLLADTFVRAFASAIAEGPHGQDILAIARGTSRLVVKQHPTASGWVITTEAVE